MNNVNKLFKTENISVSCVFPIVIRCCTGFGTITSTDIQNFELFTN